MAGLAACAALAVAGCTTVGTASCDGEDCTGEVTAPAAASPAAAAERAPSPQKAAERRAAEALARLPDLAATPGEGRGSVVPPGPGAKLRVVVLADAVSRAIAQNPQIGMAQARFMESKAGIGVAKAPGLPQLEAAFGAGVGVLGNYSTGFGNYWDTKNAQGGVRTEGNGAFRQILFNFGATKADVERAMQQMDADGLRTVATTEEIAHNAALAYLRVQQQRELVQLATENVVALKRIAKLVEENERNGNATVADVKRTVGRVIDAESGKADQEYELHLAVDRFVRLARAEPGALRPAPALATGIPPTQEAAIAEARRLNPEIVAQKALVVAAKREIDVIKLGGMPVVSLDGLYNGKHINGNTKSSEIDARALVSVRYKFLDGGLQSSQIDQAAARVVLQEQRLQAQEEDIEADLRKFYWQVGTSRAKVDSLTSGVAATSAARDLYEEQFRGGKRSLLELLEVQNSYYLARRSEIQNRFETLQATYGILRAVGRFVRTALAGR